MSLIKTTASWAEHFDQPGVQIVNLSRGGLLGGDRAAFTKRASSELLRGLDGLREKVASYETLIHMLAIGSTEAFGPNRNADGFRAATCRDYHPTFVKHAKFYRDHLNKDPKKSYGRIVQSAWNAPMQRVELLVALNNNEEAAKKNGGLVADRELEKLASGKDLGVSMACVMDPAYPVLTRDRGYVGIADIRVGDMVWTHNGRWRAVTQLNRRRYTGEVHKFRVNGMPLELELTADHPMWAKVFAGSREAKAIVAKACRYFTAPDAFDAAPAGWTHACHVDVGDRFFYRPVTRYTGYGEITDTSLAAVLGYYTAEGSLGYNGELASRTEFTCNMSDSLPRRLPKLVEAMFPDLVVTITPKSNSKPALTVAVNSTEFAEFMRQYVGRGSANKQIPPEIFNTSREIKLAFLGAWFDGDGWVDKKGGHWSSCNPSLVLQGRDLLISIGVPASIYRIDHSKCATSGYENSGIEYTLNVAHLDLWNLSGVAAKVADYPTPVSRGNRPPAMRFCPDGSYAYRISQATTRHVTDVETYNFEVDEDESYSLGGFISHNCRIAHDICSYCGNEATTTADYCRGTHQGGMCKAGGLRDNIGELIEIDGGIHHLHADNPRPQFFDISHVFRPADRIAYVTGSLEKSATTHRRTIKSADLARQLGVVVPYELVADGNQPRAIAKLVKLAYDLAAVEACLASDRPPFSAALATAFKAAVQGDAPLPLPSMVREKFASALRALADQRICLPLSRFIELAADMPFEKAAETAAVVGRELPGVYTRLLACEDLADKIARSRYTPTEAAAPPLFAGWASKLASDLSLANSHVQTRVTRAALYQETAALRQEIAREKSASVCEAPVKLAEEYALYKLAFLGTLDDKDPELQLTRSLVVVQNYAV